MTDGPHRVDRLWPDPALDLELDDAMAGFHPLPVGDDRPVVAINMVTSIDGRAQLDGTAEGLGSRADRRLMRLYRAAFDAVGSGVGTLRADGVWLRVGNDLAARRAAQGLPPNPIGRRDRRQPARANRCALVHRRRAAHPRRRSWEPDDRGAGRHGAASQPR